ncbi:RNA terminal phosphate cyclase 1 [Rhipicephalus microplus]|uniref:RNA terminal phosphate cyclase 1 n=1 Tax=Rhipicephalus microplus TaxID=6941 RepID=UPI003F6AFA97
MAAPRKTACSQTYSGCNFFRQRLVLSTLSSKPIEIKNIRHKDEEPGLRKFEVDLLKLLEKVTNGTGVEINETGTCVRYRPGLLYGGKLEHHCSTERSVGYYLEALLCLAPFCKKPLDVTLTGVTHHPLDPSVDALKHASLPVLGRFIFTEGLDITVMSRAVAPLGGGRVRFRAPICRSLRPVRLQNSGKVKRVRGWAFTVRVSPTVANRVVSAAKGVLLGFLPDVYLYTDHTGGAQGTRSPGFGICLVAETTQGAFLCAEAMSNPAGVVESPSVPEDVGEQAARALLREIYRGGCVDSSNQGLAALCMCLGPPDVSKCIVGPLTPYTIQMLRHLRDFFGVTFKVEGDCPGEGAPKVQLTCVGVGFSNLAKTTS